MGALTVVLLAEGTGDIGENQQLLTGVPNPESLDPHEAKDQLAQQLAMEADRRSARRARAETLPLDALAKACPSFGACLDKLRRA